jgi:hypothetical protein
MTTTTVIEHAENCDPEHWMGQNFKQHKEHKVEDTDEVQLDLVIAEGRMRFSIEAREFMFGYVFKRPELEFEEKFALLIRMLTERATEASVNRGAQALLQQRGLGVLYPSISVFNDETVWLLHRRRLQAAQAASTEPPPASEPSAAA